MGLKERFYDRLGFKRESTINSMKANPTLKNGDIVKVAETGYFYNIKESSTSIPLNNGLFAEVKQTTFLQIVTNCINNLSNLIQQFNTHKGTMATPSQDGHMSSSDKSKLDGIANNANNYSLPAATTGSLGGIIVGNNLTIDPSGRLNAQSQGVEIHGNRNSGYAIFPGGYIEQWIHSTAWPSHNGIYNFPIPFPNDCLSIIVGRNRIRLAGGNDSEGIGAIYIDKTKFKMQADIIEPGFWVRACGY